MNRDIELCYVEAGSGAPPLVFVHGFSGSRVGWEPQFAHFAKSHRVVVPELRGHGDSPRGEAEMTIENLADDLGALLERLDLTGAVLIGHSMGCRVSLETCRGASGRVAGVVLIDGSNVGIGGKEEAQRRLDELIAAEGYVAFARKLYDGMFLEGHDPELKAFAMARGLAFPAETGYPLFRNLMAYDADRAVAAMRETGLPVLVLQSTAMGVDRVRRSIPEGGSSPYMDLVLANCPRAEGAVIPGRGHFAQLEAPETVNARIEAFLSGRID